MKKWRCVICDWVYDEALGCALQNIPPGTKWHDLPDDFYCPDCGVGKDDFELVE